MESPFIIELIAGARQDSIIQNLETRFGAAPSEIVVPLRAILDQRKLKELHRQSILCPDLEAFRRILTANPLRYHGNPDHLSEMG
jgi:hypothetical protein